MYNGGGFYNQYVGMPAETPTRPAPAPKPNPPRREEPMARPPPRPTVAYQQPQYPTRYHPRAPATMTQVSSGNGALIAQLGILAVIALLMFMKLNSS